MRVSRLAPLLIAASLLPNASAAIAQSTAVAQQADGVSATTGAIASATSEPAQTTADPQPPSADPLPVLDAMPGADATPDPLTPQEVEGPPPRAPGAPAQATSTAPPSTTTPPAAASTAPPAMPTTPATAAIDPLLVAVRARLLTAAAAEGSDAAADQAGLVAYYSQATTAIWTDRTGLSDKGRQALAGLARANNWGLDTSRLAIPPAPASGAAANELAAFEIALGRAVLSYARHARGGRIDPPSLSRMLDRKPRIYEPSTVLAGIAAASAADAYLLTLHPQHRQFRLLQKALVALDGTVNDEPPDVRIPAGPTLREGERHDHVALLRRRLGVVAAADADAELFDDTVREAVAQFQRERGLKPDGLVGSGTRDALNGAARGSTEERRRLIVANMERWRWMPDDLGALHVWNNVPEQRTRVVDNGVVAFDEKIVVGKPSTPTMQFSANMKYVIFHPTWGVPDGIKSNELAPMLRRASGNNSGWFFGGGGPTPSSVLNRVGGLQASIGGRPVNPDSVDWSRIDIRRVSFTQPAGTRNVLGVVKFRFPNKHDIYMHDTPERHLFNNGERAFSHGCLRVQNPVRLAEVLLERDKGWSPAIVRGHLARNSTQDILLSRQIPVHVVYFTATASEDGKLTTFRDLYGVDTRVASALEGRTVRVASGAAEPPARAASNDRPARAKQQRRAAARSQPQPRQEFSNPFGWINGN